MNITKFAIDNNRITAIALLIIFLAGISSYQKLPRNEDPGFIIRVALVMTYFPGASPERVEQLVTDKLEKAIQEITELDFVRSESKTGVSMIYVNILESHRNMRPIWDNLRRKVDKAAQDLPDGVRGPFVNDEFGDVFGIVLTVTGDGFNYRDIKNVADDVRDELLRQSEVAKVDIYGDQEERIFLDYNNSRLSELGISPGQLQQLLEAQNIVLPGGDIQTADEKIGLEPSGNFESVEEIRRTVVSLPGSREVLFLEDLVDVYRGYIDPPDTLMRSNAEPALGLGISMQKGGNITKLGQQVRRVIAQAQQEFPIGIEFDEIQFQPQVVDKKIKNFTSSLFQAVIIVTAVMLAFLGLRTGLIVASLIPMAIVMSILCMSVLGIGLDQMSLAALIISLGLLVDNAIVMAEAAMVRMSAGERALDAAIESANELKIPLLTSSLTTAAAFLPIYLAESNVGEYTAPIFTIVALTLLCSWVLAITMIPLFCVLFLRVKPSGEEEPFSSPFYRRYRGVLLLGVRHPWLSLAATGFIFFLAMIGFGKLPVYFFPANDKPTFTAKLEFPNGTPIEKTDAMVADVETFIRQHLMVNDERKGGIVNWGAFVGESAPRFDLPFNPVQASPNFAYLLVNTTSREDFPFVISRLELFCQERYPDLKAIIRPLETGPPTYPPIVVRVSGRETDKLFEIMDQVKAQLRSIPGTKLIDDDWGSRSKKLIVQVNQPRALRAGVTSQDVATSLQAYLTGLDITQYREEDKLIPVTLRSVGAVRDDIAKLESINVYAQATGQSVPLKQVADIEIEWQPSTVHRRDRLRSVSIEAALHEGTTATEVNALLGPWLKQESETWGLGYFWEFGGEAEASGKGNSSIGEKLPVAGLIILLLLVAQFNSIRKPVIILLTIPLGLIGVVIGLHATNLYFGFMTMLGILSLAGIIINNAIVLIDRINTEIQDNGLEPARAIIVSAQHRLRPILLTTITTVGGLLPLYTGGGPMWEPMAIAIMSGLFFATLLTLGVVPVLYSLFFRVNFKEFQY
ncbi:MAG: efflux RND transporter permease subunit [Nitrospirae bacterium]|nr:efflux RND transporter permease subunit [Nitrospirota bacterium]MDA1304311.1 efflux RND transporter permease subunit [Nitrospirota bacterium]